MKTILRHDWDYSEIEAYFELPLIDLLYLAHKIHRQHFDPHIIQTCRLISIKTGACPEDCAYCPQSGHYATQISNTSLSTKEPFMSLDRVLAFAKQAKTKGCTRFCMGAAWRSPVAKYFGKVLTMIEEVKKLGLETCVTLGLLSLEQSKALKSAGLDYYNHNLDTSPEYYKKIITTRTFQNRLDTLENVRAAGIKVCCGGIVGMGETRQDRIQFLQQLANLPEHPHSVPINHLAKVEGTPLAQAPELDKLEFVRVIATARILMPKSKIRLSAGRDQMSDELQTLCFLAGANSVFFGDEVLFLTGNPSMDKDKELFDRLKLITESDPEKKSTKTKTAKTIKLELLWN